MSVRELIVVVLVIGAELVQLKELTKLSELLLDRDTQVTDAGIKELEQAVPGLTIYQ